MLTIRVVLVKTYYYIGWVLPYFLPQPHTDGDQVCKMISQEKWEKTQLLIRELSTTLEQDLPLLQRLLVIRGYLYLIYAVRTYSWLNPYIKGPHLTIDSWRPGREESGFKMRGKGLERAMAARAESRGLPCRHEDEGPDEGGPPPRPNRTTTQQTRPRWTCALFPGFEGTWRTCWS